MTPPANWRQVVVSAFVAWVGALPGTALAVSFFDEWRTVYWMYLLLATPTAAIAVCIDVLSRKVDARFVTEWWHTLPLSFVMSPIVSFLIGEAADNLALWNV